jgi:Tfp pilus assembly protein PilN
MLTDLLMLVVMLVGVCVVGSLLGIGVVLLCSSHERQRVQKAWVKNETLRASRRIHDLTSVAFQAMLEEARRARGDEQR